jgi:hypothetical protein
MAAGQAAQQQGQQQQHHSERLHVVGLNVGGLPEHAAADGLSRVVAQNGAAYAFDGQQQQQLQRASLSPFAGSPSEGAGSGAGAGAGAEISSVKRLVHSNSQTGLLAALPGAASDHSAA